MWVFWIVTGLFAAAAAALVLARAGAAARAAVSGSPDPTRAVHRRQLVELDEAAEAGLLGPDELRAARAEAGRRLLRSVDGPENRRRERPGGRGSRLAAVVVSVGAAALALFAYLRLGAPGLPDQPYAARLAGWRRADPSTLDPPRMVAVLREITRDRPHDPLAWQFLGRAELAAGDPFDAARAFHSASALAPGRADLLTAEGEALLQDSGGKTTPEAAAVFRHALQVAPQDKAARYFLARSEIAGGDTAAGLAGWRALLADMSETDPRRASLAMEIDHVAGGARPGEPATAAVQEDGGGPTPPALPALAQGPQAAFIHAMVDRQAAELKSNPDNPSGWARLVRSYRVLGDRAAEAQALAEARRLFARRPDALKPIEAEAG